MELEVKCRICKGKVIVDVYWIDEPPELDVICEVCRSKTPKVKSESYKKKEPPIE